MLRLFHALRQVAHYISGDKRGAHSASLIYVSSYTTNKFASGRNVSNRHICSRTCLSRVFSTGTLCSRMVLIAGRGSSMPYHNLMDNLIL